MATAEDGEAAANTTSSSYGGGGAGGKFRKKFFRRQPTPYDRPSTGLRGNSNSTSSWLTKLVVDPASKLISYGADRFFASLLRKRLPPPPPPQPPEVKADAIDGVQVAVPNRQETVQERTVGDCGQPMNSSSSKGISELEQLLKQKTFTRSEIAHLTELLQSKAAEAPLRDDGEKNKGTASDFGRHQQFASGPLEENRNGENRSSAIISTPVLNSKVVEDDIAAPAELAKAYMGSRPSKVSPSVLGMRSQVGREDAGLRSNIPLVSKSPMMSLTEKTSVSLAAPENGIITPRSRGRSAIYNMARTPYSRVHPTSILKGSVLNSYGYAGSSISPSPSLTVKGEKFESQPMTLKRRSSVLDDEVGSVGPIRRIRQKPNLLAHRSHHGVGISSHAKQNLQLIGEPSYKALKAVGETENDCVPSTSYARVPSKSTEVASRILQHLEKLTPKEKSSESKLRTVREKSPLKLTSSMLSGQALRSMEDVDSSKLLLDAHDDHRLENRTNATLLDAWDSSSQKQGKVEENGPKGSVVPSNTWNPIKSNDSAVSLKTSSPSTKATDSVIKNGASQVPQRKRAFRMSAQEDSLEQDDDVQCNGLASRPFSENKGSMETLLKDGKLAPAEEPRLEKPRIQPEDKSLLGLILSKTSELSNPGGSAITVGKRSSVVAFPASEETTAALQSAVLPLSVAPFDKLKESNNPPPKVADKFPFLPSESNNKAEPKLESSSGLVTAGQFFSSLVNVPMTTGPLVKISESEKGFQVSLQKAGDAASNGPPVSSPPALTFTAASSSDTKQAPAGGALLFSVPSGTSTSTSATTTGSIFGLSTKPSSSAASVFKFGAAVDPSSAASAASVSNISEAADMRTKDEIDPSSGSSSSSFSTSAFAAASTGTSTFGLGSSVSSSTENNFQGSLFASASKPLASGAATVSLGASVQSLSSAPLPSFATNGSTSLGSSFSNSKSLSPNNTFGFSSSASSSDTSAIIPAGVPTPGVFKFGASSTAVSEATAVSSSSSAPPGIFNIGFSSSSSSTNAVGTSAGATLPIFGSSGSSVSASVVNTASSFISGTPGVFNFVGNSSATSSSSAGSSIAPSSNAFGSSWQSTKSPIFGSSSSGFSFGASSTSSAPTNVAPSTGFSFGALSTSSTTTNASPFSFGAASTSSVTTNASPFSFGASSTSSAPTNEPPSTGFSFGASSEPTNASSSTVFSFGAPTNASQSAGFSFGASSTSSAPTNAAPPMVFNSSSQSPFSFTVDSASVFSSPSLPVSQPVFGGSGFAASPGNNDQMNAEDSMAEDPVQSSAPSMPVFGQPSPPGFAFGSAIPSPGPSPFMFGGQQNQAAPQNPSPFQASGSLGGSFSLGSGGGGDKSGRKIVKINRNKNRKK